MDRLKSFPIGLIFVAFLAYLGYQFYDFNYSADGPVEMHKTQVINSNNEVLAAKKKLEEGQKFLKSLELKKTEIKELVKKLSDYQGALSEALDVPSMIKLLITEAKKIELKVEKIEPGKKDPKEFYLEQEFHINLKGSFQQIVLFIQRVSALQRIIRIEGFSMRPATTASGSITNSIAAELSVRVYQYSLSKEDEIGKGGKW